jgi:hypothetical protein
MAIFRKKSTASAGSGGSGGKPSVNITKQDERNYKVRTSSVHDPILQAVNEAQPFENSVPEESNRMSLQQQQGLHDVFGKPIVKPDISNPTRARDERPLDTIRSFEYAITGDNSYRDRLESETLGFRVRQDFPQFGANPYGNSTPSNSYGNEFSNGPVHSFTGGEQGVYEAPKKEETKKKKRGLFGKKK